MTHFVYITPRFIHLLILAFARFSAVLARYFQIISITCILESSYSVVGENVKDQMKDLAMWMTRINLMINYYVLFL